MSDNNIDSRLTRAISKLSRNQKEELLAVVNGLPVEKRDRHRTRHLAEVTYADSRRSVSGYIQNISANGLYIEPNGPFDVGQRITLIFEHPSRDYHLKLSGTVARKDTRGIGVKFEDPVKDI